MENERRRNDAPAEKPIRAFIAIELPQELRERLARLQRALQQELQRELGQELFRWTPPENLHLTLRFLGQTSPSQQETVTAGLRTIAQDRQPLSLALQGLGIFPSPSRPRVIWVGLGGALAELARLQEAVEQLAQEAGFQAESRGFSPHVTIARAQRHASSAQLRAAGARLQPRLARPGEPLGRFTAREIALIRSQLRRGGPVYTPLAHFPLGREAAAGPESSQEGRAKETGEDR